MKGSKKEEAPAIGIDLGTTSSCVGVFENDRVHIIPNHLGYRTTASYVSYEGNRRLVGDGAKKLAVKNPSNTIFDTKRLIGRRFTDPIVQADMKLWPFRVIQGPSDTPKIVVRSKGKELQLSAEEISSMILEKMKETAEDYLQKAVKKAVITVPAYFNESQRQATKDAGAIAGLDVIRIINEPTAAAIAYGLDKKSKISGRTNVLVFDLGGGTFDVSLMTIEEGNNFQVKAVAGDAHLGGEDFDDRMVSDCVREFKRKFNKDLAGNQRALGRLRVACEKAKKELSYDTMTSIELDCLHDNEDFSMIFRRNQFDKLNVASFKKCIETVEQCLRDANMVKSSVDEVILVGGSTRIPKIKEMLREFFDGRDLSASVNPDEAVACGAAIMAAKLSGSSDKSVQDLILSDVTPLSLGVALQRDVFDVVIPRNTPIPTKKSKIYLTTIDNQSETCVEVYQGERIKCTDNHLLGKFLFSGIPPAPKGKIHFEDSFEIDADGILTVTSKILSTGKTEKITITSENGRLSKEEIEKMIKDAEMYKREDQEFRNRMDAYNELQDRLDETENMIDDSEIKKRVHTRSLKKIEDVVADTTEWLHENVDASVNDLKSKQAAISSSSVKRPRGNDVSKKLVNTGALHGPVRKSKRMKVTPSKLRK